MANYNAGNGVIWVQGIDAAKAYPVAPGTAVPLFDVERPTIYIKTTDNIGFPTIKILDYTIRDQQPQAAPQIMQNNQPQADYVSKQELQTELGQIRDAIQAIAAGMQPKEEKA